MKVLVIEARFYEPISDMLLDGAMAALNAVGADVTRVTVPGALETGRPGDAVGNDGGGAGR